MFGPAELPEFASSAETIVKKLLRNGEIEIRTGSHAGARQPITAATTSIGSGLDDDVVLLGDGLMPDHARLSVGGLIGNRMSIEARGGDVDVVGRETIPAGYRHDVALPAVLRMAGTEIRVAGSSVASRLPSRTLTALVVGMAATLALAINASSVTSAFIGRQSVVPVAAVATPAPVDAEGAKIRLRSMLSSAGLLERVFVTADDGNAITLRGRVEGARGVAAWRGFLKTLDGVGDLPHVTLAVQVSEAAPTAPAVASVWHGRTPYAILKDGNRLAVGDVTSGGWTMESIEKDGIVFKGMGGELIRVRLGTS